MPWDTEGSSLVGKRSYWLKITQLSYDRMAININTSRNTAVTQNNTFQLAVAKKNPKNKKPRNWDSNATGRDRNNFLHFYKGSAEKYEKQQLWSPQHNLWLQGCNFKHIFPAVVTEKTLHYRNAQDAIWVPDSSHPLKSQQPCPYICSVYKACCQLTQLLITWDTYHSHS